LSSTKKPCNFLILQYESEKRGGLVPPLWVVMTPRKCL
jgi:hypothetical protein